MLAFGSGNKLASWENTHDMQFLLMSLYFLGVQCIDVLFSMCNTGVNKGVWKTARSNDYDRINYDCMCGVISGTQGMLLELVFFKDFVFVVKILMNFKWKKKRKNYISYLFKKILNWTLS